MTHHGDHALMARLAADDESALGELVALHAPALLAFARRMLPGSSHDAEDVVQEVFVRTWRARHRWQPTAAVKNYLYTIATNLCLNRRRLFRRTPPSDPLPDHDAALVPELHAGTPDPERQAAAAQLRAALATEFAALPAAQRAAFVLRHEAGMTYAEIAAALDTSATAVESLLARARARLRQRLAAWRTDGNAPLRG